MILFLISFLLTVFTGFFITAIFEQKNFIKIFIYMCTVMFSSVILNVEILSLLSKITASNILILNILIAIGCGFFWLKKGKPGFRIKSRRFFKRIYFALISDKYLIILGLAFLFMCLISIFLIYTMPVVNSDAWNYHVARSYFWIGNASLNHFEVADIRNLTMPINSEILYLWVLIFLKKDILLGNFSFVGFLLTLVSLYGIMGKIRFSERHKLWTIFILSSFPAIIVQISGTETDIIIAGLVLSSIYLYWDYFKNKHTNQLYFASLVYAIAAGTKTTSLMLMIPVGLWMLWIGYKYVQKEVFKIFLKFLGFGTINFLIFSSYNYFLNFIDYGNIFGQSIPFIYSHKNNYGFAGMAAGFIKHMFLFFDTTGFHMEKFGENILAVKENILSFFNLDFIPDGKFNPDSNIVNSTILEPLAGLGILGFILYVPCWIYAIVKPIFSKTFKTQILFSFALILLFTILFMSYEITFMKYSIRFIACFCTVCAPIIAYSYWRKNSIFKFIITLYALFGLILVSTHLWARPFNRIANYFRQGASLEQVQYIARCSSFKKNIKSTTALQKAISEKNIDLACAIQDTIRTFDKNERIMFFSSYQDYIMFIKSLEFEGYNIDFGLMENIDKYNLKNYDKIILGQANTQYVSNIQFTDKIPKYVPEKGVTCYYGNENGEIILDNNIKPNIVYRAICDISVKYLSDKGFELYKIIPDVKNIDLSNADTVIYQKIK